MQITMYSKPNCVQCVSTKRKLDNMGIEYEVIDVVENPEAAEMLRNEGFMQMPVVFAGEERWSGFRPDIITKVLKPVVA